MNGEKDVELLYDCDYQSENTRWQQKIVCDDLLLVYPSLLWYTMTSIVSIIGSRVYGGKNKLIILTVKTLDSQNDYILPDKMQILV